MSAWTKALPYFPEHELACSHCGVVKLDRRFAAALPGLRLEADRALSPSSVCRCPEHNVAVRGHVRSMHLTEQPQSEIDLGRGRRAGAMGADFLWGHWTDQERRDFAILARRRGWAVGLNTAFAHVDWRIAIGLEPTTFEYGGWVATWGRATVEAAV